MLGFNSPFRASNDKSTTARRKCKQVALVKGTSFVSQAYTDTRIATLDLGRILSRVYLHEVALHSGMAEYDMQPPFTEDSFAELSSTSDFVMSASFVKSLSICLSQIHELLDKFLSIPLEEMRCLPVFQFVRIVYAVVVLVKISVRSDTARVGFGSSANIETRKQAIHEYMSALIRTLRSAADGSRCASAAKFGAVLFSIRKCLERLRLWSQSDERKWPMTSETRRWSSGIDQGSRDSTSRTSDQSGMLSGKDLGHTWTAPFTADIQTNAAFGEAQTFDNTDQPALPFGVSGDTDINMSDNDLAWIFSEEDATQWFWPH